MKNHFGEFDESVLKALRDAYNPNANSFAESYDFTQCQRTDGTIYGTSGSCAQKGAKEVKNDKGDSGLGWWAKNMSRNLAKVKDIPYDKLTDAQLKQAINVFKSSNFNTDEPQQIEKVAKSISTLSTRSKDAGKGAISVSSLLSKKDLKVLEDPKALSAFMKGLGVSENSPEMKNAMAIINKGKPAAKPKAETKPAPKADAKSKTQAQDLAKLAKQQEAVKKAEADAKKAEAKAKSAKVSGAPATQQDLADLRDNVRSYRSDGMSQKQIQEEIDDYARYYAKENSGGSKAAEEQMRKAGYAQAGIKYSSTSTVDTLKAEADAARKKAAEARKKYDSLEARQARARGRSNSRLIDAAKKSGCTYEQIKSGNCMF